MDSFLQDLHDASTNLFYTSETDAPIDVVFIDDDIEDPLTGKDVIEYFKEPLDAPVEVADAESFFKRLVKADSSASVEARVDAAKSKYLKKLLEQNLTDIQVFRVGEVEVNVYVLGRTANGAFAGIKTMVVES